MLNSVVKITFQYEVIDNVEEIATVSTPTAIGAGKARKPTGRESGPTTSTFTFSVALFTLEDLNTIDAQIGATPTLTVNGLVAALGPTGDLGVRVLAAAPLVGLAGTALATDFQALTLPIRDGETLTVAYSDAAPVATVTATGTIDLAPPTIAIVQPADNSFAGSQSTLSLTVADSGAGLTLAAIRDGIRTLPAVSGEIVETTTPTSAASYTLTQTPTAAAPIPEGLTLMWAGAPGTSVIRDAVGNQPVGSGVALVADPTARALNTRGTRANPFHFTVDPAAPTLASARTGGKLDTNPTSATLGQIIADSTARNAITVTLDLGIGGAPVDPDTIQTGDFTVTGDSVAFTVIAVIIGTQVGTTQNLLLVLSSDLPTGALPIVKLVGELKDKAGNSQSNVTIPQNQVVDDLAPVITVTMTGDASSRPISNKEVVIGVTSSEPVTIAGTARYLVISGDNTLQDDPTTATAALAFTSTGTNTWEATVLINSILPILTFRNSGLVNVQVIVADDAGNVGIAGLADPDGTIQRAVAVISAGALVFEFDNRLNDGVFDPGKIFALSPGPLITINFDAEGNEYAVTSGDTVIKVDSHPDVDLTKAILTMPDGSTGDVLAQFGNADANSFVMDGTALDTGDYILTVQAKDILGNNGPIRYQSCRAGRPIPRASCGSLRLLPGTFWVRLRVRCCSRVKTAAWGLSYR